MANVCEVRDQCVYYTREKDKCTRSEIPGMFEPCRARRGILEQLSEKGEKDHEDNVIRNPAG